MTVLEGGAGIAGVLPGVVLTSQPFPSKTNGRYQVLLVLERVYTQCTTMQLSTWQSEVRQQQSLKTQWQTAVKRN